MPTPIEYQYDVFISHAVAEGMPLWVVGPTGGQVGGTVLRLGALEKVPCSYYQIEGGVRSTGDGSNFFPILFGDLIECTPVLNRVTAARFW